MRLKRLILTSLFMILLSSVGNAESRMYIGADDNGKFIAGLEVNQPIPNTEIRLIFDVCSIDVQPQKNTPNLDFKPLLIKYVGGFEINGFGYEHSCVHEIDGIKNVLGKDLQTDKIYYKWSY